MIMSCGTQVLLDGSELDNEAAVGNDNGVDRVERALDVVVCTGREVGGMSPRSAASRRFAEHDVGTGRSTVISARTGTAIGGRPFMASWDARRAWATYLRVAAGV
jgi:hypothetical protein